MRKVVEAQKLWFAILESQTETGTPYMMYKDSCNSKSNQQNLGTIKCSNLCTEIVEFTSPNEVSVYIEREGARTRDGYLSPLSMLGGCVQPCFNCSEHVCDVRGCV